MCGITGWIDWQGNVEEHQALLTTMVQTLAKRGPDAEGIWLSNQVAFGHRRLSVIDPENGSQPMTCTQAGVDYAITYNGELYNFRELQGELRQCGHQFRTQCDTEVLLKAYIEWGAGCVERFNGIFAFAIWDGSREQLFMARDHLGVKPLYYAQRGSCLIFGSELKALLAHPLVKAEVDMKGLSELFCFGLMHTPGTAIYREIQEVRAGHYLINSRQGLTVRPYWQLKSQPHTDDVESTAARIRELLTDTVERQLIADVPVVTLLSGGLDSSLLTSLAAKNFADEGKLLHTYSIDFVDSEADFQPSAVRPDLDAPWVERVSKYLNTVHHKLLIDSSELLENHFVALEAHDLPGMGEIETSLYLICKKMKQHATVALSGESADELFGGYAWFHQPEILKVQNFPFLFGPFPFMVQRLLSILSPDLERAIAPDDYVRSCYEQAQAEVPQLDGESAEAARWREIFYHHLIRFLPLILSRKDRMSMAAGFEVRVPYCDYRLVEYVWNIPWDMKNVDGIEKGILRRAGLGLLPKDALYRKKCSYPGNQSQSYYQTLRTWTVNLLDNSQSPILDLIDIPKVRAIASGQGPSIPQEFEAYVLNFIIQTNLWLRDYNVSIC